MAYFFFKLVPPRPSFPQDITEAEGELMKRHAAYWQSLLDKGFVLVFGPVLDPKGPYGAGIATFADDETARSFAADDPVIKADWGSRMRSVPWQPSPENHNQKHEKKAACRASLSTEAGSQVTSSRFSKQATSAIDAVDGSCAIDGRYTGRKRNYAIGARGSETDD
jgi:uncharacterized protein YciI